MTCKAYQREFRGWAGACVLDNGLVRLVAVPDIGGRVMACDLGPYPFFFVDADLAGKLFSSEENQGDGSLGAWKNYGGDKTWPAPQGWERDDQWHGPPDPVLDTGRYTLDDLSADGASATVRMTSPADPRTGVQITRQFTLQDDSSRVMVSISFRNTTQHTIRWSIWDVVQLRAERPTDDGGSAHESAAIITAPLHPASTFPRHYNVMFGADENPQWQVNTEQGLFEAPYLWHIGKVGLDNPGGWIAFSNPAAGFAFCQRYDYEPGAEYPDGGASAEVWTTGAGRVGNFDYESHPVYLMEAEVLSPLRTIPPGETTSFSIEWGLCRANAKVREVSEGGAVIAPLRARLAGGLVHVTGTFGVFERGGLWLSWLDANGSVADAFDLGPVDPLALVTVDRILPYKAEYQRALVKVSASPDVSRTVAMLDLE